MGFFILCVVAVIVGLILVGKAVDSGKLKHPNDLAYEKELKRERIAQDKGRKGRIMQYEVERMERVNRNNAHELAKSAYALEVFAEKREEWIRNVIEIKQLEEEHVKQLFATKYNQLIERQVSFGFDEVEASIRAAKVFNMAGGFGKDDIITPMG